LSTAYLGTLQSQDPLYDYLRKDVLPVMDREVRDPRFHVSRLSGSNMVYRYDEERTRLSLIGKFYNFMEPYKARRLIGEFDNLKKARALGLTSLPNYVVRPISREKKMGLGLLEEYIEGHDLDYYIRGAAYDGRHGRLKERLSELAYFLSEFHKRAGSGQRLKAGPPAEYFEKLLGKLYKKKLLDDRLLGEFRKLKELWLERDCMREDNDVVIHGDATPTNFIFPREKGVIAIDLERMRTGDRMFDVGMVSGELKHAFIWRTGNKYTSEPYIGHFLAEYSGHFRKSEKMFRSTMLRNPFFMAMTELRIARNGWLDRQHRIRLVQEARECLHWGLKLK